MGVLESLVVGVDGSATAAAALDWATERVAPNGVLHVVSAAAGAALDEVLLAPLRARVAEVRGHVIAGPAAPVLIELADEHQVDGIVVGAHGSGRSRRVLGRVTTKLLHDAPRPVFVINPRPSETGPARGRVVACVGYGDASDAAARWAAAYADGSGLGLELLHVVGSRPMIPTDSLSDTIASYFGAEVVRDWAQSDLDALRDDLASRFPSLEIGTRLERGSPLRSIEAASEGAELVVMGKRSRRLLGSKRLGHRLHHLVVRVAAPVAVVPCAAEA